MSGLNFPFKKTQHFHCIFELSGQLLVGGWGKQKRESCSWLSVGCQETYKSSRDRGNNWALLGGWPAEGSATLGQRPGSCPI